MNNHHIDILLNAIALLIREDKKLGNIVSLGLVRRVIEVIPNGKSGVMSIENDIVGGLRSLITDIIDVEPIVLDSRAIVQTLSLLFTDETKHILNSFVEGLEDELTDKQEKSRLENLRRSLDEFYLVNKGRKIFSTASFKLRNEISSIKDTKKYLNAVLGDLEALTSGSRETDEAIVDEIDFGNRDDVVRVAKEVEDESTVGGKFVLGWQAANDMFQDGFTRGEFVGVNALAHKYKTGFTLSMFLQMVLYNNPQPNDPLKKQLAVWISFEDDVTSILQFIYLYIKKNETGICPNVKSIDADEMTDFVMGRLQERGWNVKILRVNPSDWTYRHLFNKILEYNNSNFEVEILGIDYLAMLPTIGCTQGPHGVDIRDLFRRTRNFCSSRDILVLTPHQLGPGAKNLLKNGVEDEDLAQQCVGRGFYSGSSQLDQEYDVSIVIHKATINSKSYLTVVLEKHRRPMTVDENKKMFILPFKNKGPITDDIGKEIMSFKSYSDIGTEETELF